MKVEHINPSKLNAKQKEIYNFQRSAGILADYGYNCLGGRCRLATEAKLDIQVITYSGG